MNKAFIGTSLSLSSVQGSKWTGTSSVFKMGGEGFLLVSGAEAGLIEIGFTIGRACCT